MSAEYTALSAKRDFDAAEKTLKPYRTAREYILNAKADYIKKKTKARSRKKALENTFADLEHTTSMKTVSGKHMAMRQSPKTNTIV